MGNYTITNVRWTGLAFTARGLEPSQWDPPSTTCVDNTLTRIKAHSRLVTGTIYARVSNVHAKHIPATRRRSTHGRPQPSGHFTDVTRCFSLLSLLLRGMCNDIVQRATRLTRIGTVASSREDINWLQLVLVNWSGLALALVDGFQSHSSSRSSILVCLHLMKCLCKF